MARVPRVGSVQQKILLLLLATGGLLLSTSPRTSFRVLKSLKREWQEIDRKTLQDSIRRLYRSRLVDARDHPDGTTTLMLSDEGKRRALSYRIDEMKIAPMKSWDHYWRLITFDIPETRRKARDALRNHLKQLGCYELQRSVFVHPYDCRNEIDFLIEFYDIRRHVRFIVAQELDNAPHLRKIFRV